MLAHSGRRQSGSASFIIERQKNPARKTPVQSAAKGRPEPEVADAAVFWNESSHYFPWSFPSQVAIEGGGRSDWPSFRADVNVAPRRHDFAA